MMSGDAAVRISSRLAGGMTDRLLYSGKHGQRGTGSEHQNYACLF